MDEKMFGVMLSDEYVEKLARILKANKRTRRGQVECWIDEEIRLLDRMGK